MTLDDIKQRCHIDEDTGCWHWRGAIANGKFPRVYSQNLAKAGSPMEAQTGCRAVWQLNTGKAIPKGHRVYKTCPCPDCLNPKHMACGPTAEWGRHMSKIGSNKTMAHRIGARKRGRAMSVLTDEVYAEIMESKETGVQLAKRLGVSEQTVSKARKGRRRSFQPLGSPFAGLGARP